MDIKYETIDTQIFRFENRIITIYDKIIFRASEFFSSIDLYITTFNYGYKYYISKSQISDNLSGADLSKNKPAEILKIYQSNNVRASKRNEK